MRIRSVLILMIVIMVITTSVFAAVCETGPAVRTAKVNYFTATPHTIALGSYSTLAWHVDAADTVVITGGTREITGLPVKGTHKVSPKQDTIYTLTVSAGGKTRSVQTYVRVQTKLEIVRFLSGSGDGAIHPEQDARLRWVCTGAERLQLKNLRTGTTEEIATDKTSIVVKPQVTTDYRLIAWKGARKVQKTLTVKVNDSVTITHFQVYPRAVSAGELVMVVWSVLGADRVSLSPFGDDLPASGGRMLQVSEDTKFLIKAYGNGRSVYRSFSVDVTDKLPDIVVSKMTVRKINALNEKGLTIGDECRVHAVIENSGSAVARQLRLDLYENFTTGHSVDIGRILPGEQKKYTFDWHPSFAGKGFISVSVDDDNVSGEAEERDNFKMRKLTVRSVEGAELVPNRMTVHQLTDGASAQGIYYLYYIITNDGTSASGPFQYRYYLSTSKDGSYSDCEIPLLDGSMDALDAGKKKSGTITLFLPEAPSNYWLHGVIDVHDSVKEAHEANNHFVVPVIID